MDTPETRALLRRTYLFSALNDAQLNQMLESVRLVELGAGERLFERGQEANRFFLVMEGQMKLYRLSASGDEKVIEIVRRGGTFAEAVLFMGVKGYPVNADALSPSVVASFSNEVFRELLKDSADTCFRLMASMSRRLHSRLEEIDALTLHNATYRLVAYLLELAGPKERGQQRVNLGVAKHVVASRLSIQPETFSRILKRLSKDGLIEPNGSEIEITELGRLRELMRTGI